MHPKIYFLVIIISLKICIKLPIILRQIALVEKLRNIKLKNIFSSILLYNILVSFLLFFLTTRFKILNPRYDGWLAEGDGVVEIAWEFYRNTDFPLWLIGNMETYGMEAARPAFYMLPTFYAFPLRFFSFLLGERFQFFGIIVLLSFILHFFFSSKLFEIFKLNKFNNVLASTLLLFSPIVMYRYIDHTHYTLSQNWILLAGIYFFFKRESSPLKWGLLFSASALIFPYYAVFIGSIFLIYFLHNFITKAIPSASLLKVSLVIILSILISVTISGYIFFDNNLQPDMQVNFKANLNSLYSPAGWSIFLNNQFQGEGEYEGFGFLGLNFLLISSISLILIFKNLILRREFKLPLFNLFILLAIPSFLLGFISLSNIIHFNDLIIFSYESFFLFEYIQTNFRSIGRFIWLLVYYLSVIVIYFLALNLKPRVFTIVVTLAIIVGLIDMYPKMTSQINEKFSSTYESPLNSKFWSEVSLCYENFVAVPPTTHAEYLYPMAKLAYKQNMSIFPATIPRVPAYEQANYYAKLRDDLATGNSNDSSIYIFQSSLFVSDELVELDKNIALNTMSHFSRAGTINNVFVILPEFENCKGLVERYSNELDITRLDNLVAVGNFKSFKKSLFRGFNLISGWSEIEDWGVWSNSEKSRLIVQAEFPKNINHVVISGHRFTYHDGTSPEMRIYLNGEEKYYATGSKSVDEEIVINLNTTDMVSNNFVFDFEFSTLSSPREQFGINDDRLLGFAFKSIQFE